MIKMFKTYLYLFFLEMSVFFLVTSLSQERIQQSTNFVEFFPDVIFAQPNFQRQTFLY